MSSQTMPGGLKPEEPVVEPVEAKPSTSVGAPASTATVETAVSTSTAATAPETAEVPVERPLSPGEEDYSYPGMPKDFSWKDVKFTQLTTLEAVRNAVGVSQIARGFVSSKEVPTFVCTISEHDKTAFEFELKLLNISVEKAHRKMAGDIRGLVANQLWRAGGLGSSLPGKALSPVNIGKKLLPKYPKAPQANMNAKNIGEKLKNIANVIRSGDTAFSEFYGNVVQALGELSPNMLAGGKVKVCKFVGFIITLHVAGRQAFELDSLRGVSGSLTNKGVEDVKKHILSNHYWVDCFLGGSVSSAAKTGSVVSYDYDDRLITQMDSLGTTLTLSFASQVPTASILGCLWEELTAEDNNEDPKTDREVLAGATARIKKLIESAPDTQKLSQQLKDSLDSYEKVKKLVEAEEAKYKEQVSLLKASQDAYKALEAEKVSIEEKLKEAEQEVESLKQQVATLTQKVTDLETENEELKTSAALQSADAHVAGKTASKWYTWSGFLNMVDIGRDENRWGWGDMLVFPFVMVYYVVGMTLWGAWVLIAETVIWDFMALPLRKVGNWLKDKVMGWWGGSQA